MAETELLQTALEVLRDITQHKTPRPEAVAILRATIPDPTARLDDIARAIIHRELATHKTIRAS